MAGKQIDTQPPKSPEVPAAPAKTITAKDFEALLAQTLRDGLLAGTQIANKYAGILAPAIIATIQRGETELTDELRDQIDGLRELGRIRTVQNANRLVTGMVRLTLKMAGVTVVA